MQTSEFFNEGDLALESLESNLSFDDTSKDLKGYLCTAPGCGQVLKIRKLYEQHMKAHYGEKPFMCTLGDCQKRFSQYASYMKHVRFHSGDSPYKCNLCDKSFSQLSNLKRHERLHTGEKPYSCEHCDKSFSNVSNLKQHMQVHTENQARSKFDCQRCGKSYLYQNSLSKHMKSHAKKDAKAALKKPAVNDKKKEKKNPKAAKSEESQFSGRMEMPAVMKHVKQEQIEELVPSYSIVEPSTIATRRRDSMASEYGLRFDSFDLNFPETTPNKKRMGSFLELFDEPKAAPEADFFEQCQIAKRITDNDELKEKANHRILSFLEFDFFAEAKDKDDGRRKSFLSIDNGLGLFSEYHSNRSSERDTKDSSFGEEMSHLPNHRPRVSSNFEDFLQLGVTRKSRHSSFLSQLDGERLI